MTASQRQASSPARDIWYERLEHASSRAAASPIIAATIHCRVVGLLFFFQAEDGIRDYKVTGVQTCALPIFIGSNAGQVGPGSVIVSAFLQIEITNPGGTQFLYQLTEDWTELGATWNSFATPGSPGTKGTGLSFNAPLGVITLNITAIVQNWVNEDANDGLLIWSSSADGVDYRSSESANPPTLTVTFRSP